MPEHAGDGAETQKTGAEGLSADQDCRRILVRARGELQAVIAAAEEAGSFPTDFMIERLRQEIVLDLTLRQHFGEAAEVEDFEFPDVTDSDDPIMTRAQHLDDFLQQRIDHYQDRSGEL